MNKPVNMDPESWARYNQQQQATLDRLTNHEIAVMTGLVDPKPFEHPYAAPARELKAVVNRAVCELEHQGPRSHRIAQQLLEALISFEKETGI